MLSLGVAIGRVQICNGLEALLHETALCQPSRCLREEERHDHQDKRQNDLDDEWALPGHLLWKKKVETVVHPAREHIASDEESILNAHHQTPPVWCSDLSLYDRYSHGQEANAKTLDSPTRHEGAEIAGEDLDEGAEEVDEPPKPDTLFSAHYVSQPPGDQGSHRRGRLQAGHRNASDGRIDRVSGAISATVVLEEAGYKNGIDQQPGHDT